MSPEEIDDPTYQFFDENNQIRLILIANGNVELKDCDIRVESDAFQVILPNKDEWKFDLYDQIYDDQVQTQAEKDTLNENKTLITVILVKQQTGVTWPQIHCNYLKPKTPRNSSTNDVSVLEHFFNGPEATFDLNLKKLRTEITETQTEVKFYLYVPKPEDCQVEFKETNFKIIFLTKDQTFLDEQNIPSNRLLNLIVRVKERIVPNHCEFRFTPSTIELTLVKEEPSSRFWGRIDAEEHSETPVKPSAPIALGYVPRRNALPDPYLTSNNRNESYSTTSNVVVGFTGIHNPANSCFMNAAIQCLSNTRELRDYFLANCYLNEINQQNPLGMKGEMAEELAWVLKSLWAGDQSYVYANKLRDLVAKRHQEFVGNGQHDAQELLNVVLDAIHEDVNRVISKPSVPPVEDQNRPDEIVADEFWRGYLKRNNSIVVELFTGQFKSKTKCPQCQKESVTFDPFTTLSVPVPKRINIDVVFIYRDVSRSSRKCRIVMQMDGSIRDLKVHLAAKFDIAYENLFAYKIRYNAEVEVFKDDDRAPTVNYPWNYQDYVFVAETLSCDEPVRVLTFTQRTFKYQDYVSSCAYCHADANPMRPSTICLRCHRVSYCDETCQKFHQQKHQDDCLSSLFDYFETVGIPFVISLPESQLNYQNVCEQINLNVKRYAEIKIKPSRPLENYNVEIDDDDNFSDVENLGWAVIKEKLASTDSWSICRLGDYLVQKNQLKRPTDLENNHNKDAEEFDMIEDVYPHRSLFRLMPQSLENRRDLLPAIIDQGDETNRILRSYTTFFIDWYTDNSYEAPLRIISTNDRIGLNDLIDDDSVLTSSSIDQDATLTQCLQMFIEPEVLGPDDKWYCPHCKEHIQAEKKMSIWRLPPILIIHLKRFKYNQYVSSFSNYQSHTKEKIETNVKFPIHDLDLTPYCSSTPSDSDDPSSSRYDLFGIINHRGTACFGHYTSDARLLAFNDSARSEIGWRHFDDSHVTTVHLENDLNRSDAYVLFYRHRRLNIDLPTPKPEINEQNQSNTD